ncbi:hypothetical protein BC830DRAFT_963959 [Chytriomyces sp. MP71]|nr:hypothetical protein BC830DRAFT_963959 [Chytriomyces sp. MP71]
MAQKAVASPSASVAAPAPAPVKSEEVNVIYAFQPERDDELALRMGDKVLVLHAFDDGWSYGKNLSTGQEGNFPSDCLEATAEPVDTGVKKQRLSSLHGYSTEPNARDVIYDFMPSQSDECLLYADDQVEVLQSYDDGWCYVRNLSSGSEGLCPEDCIDGFNEGGVKVGNVHKSRVSSMYAAGPKNNSAYNAGSNNYY